MTDGNISNVTNAEIAMMLARKTPTVIYGTSGANNKGVNPRAITIALRDIAIAGSSNIKSKVFLTLCVDLDRKSVV